MFFELAKPVQPGKDARGRRLSRKRLGFLLAPVHVDFAVAEHVLRLGLKTEGAFALVNVLGLHGVKHLLLLLEVEVLLQTADFKLVEPHHLHGEVDVSALLGQLDHLLDHRLHVHLRQLLLLLVVVLLVFRVLFRIVVVVDVVSASVHLILIQKSICGVLGFWADLTTDINHIRGLGPFRLK